MKTKLVAIGDSRGVCLPASLIREAGLQDEVEVSIGEGGLIVRAAGRVARAGWAEAIAAATEEDLALVLDDLVLTEFDEHEWQWK
jgi:antitoxin MazE